MKKDIPTWAMRVATFDDYELVRECYSHGRMQIRWPDLKMLRDWAKVQGWPTPRFGFEDAFIKKILENKQDFAKATKESGIEAIIPRQDYTISQEKLSELDSLYEQRSSGGRPDGWGALVEELREIRRAVEAGVLVHVDGDGVLRSWQSFYDWAHGRYHMLEDGYDHWIGDDSS